MADSTQIATDASAAYWDAMIERFPQGLYANRAEWQGHPAVQRRRSRLLGVESTSAWLANRLPDNVGRALGVGCGVALFELELLAAGTVREFDLWDVSQASLEVAEQRATALGLIDRVTIRCGDAFEVEESGYDLVTFDHSLHHAPDVVAAVEFAYERLNESGFIFADEYVGPRRFAYPPEHVEPVKALYRSLSSDLRGPWPELPLPDPNEVAAADPTESVESDLILEAIHDKFAEVEVEPMYGSLPFMLWWGLDHDALWDTRLGRDFVDFLLKIDEAVTVAGHVPSYFAVVLARRIQDKNTRT